MVFASVLLFAQDVVPDARGGANILIASVVGGVATKIADLAWGWYKERKTEGQEERASVVKHQEALIDRLDREKDDEAREARKVTRRLRRSEITATAMMQQIRYLESVFKRNGLSFESYVPPEIECDPAPDSDNPNTSGSKQQSPLPSGGGS